jgi:arylsulfatase B
MKRREFIEYSAKGISGITLSSLLLNSMGCGRNSPQIPNIIIILADDAGWNDVGYHGSEIKTPHIDRLAREGVELDNFYVSPLCSPTRAGLMTGRYPSRYGILGPILGGSTQTLPSETVTLAQLLRENGFQTSICGKWHLGVNPETGPRQYGFDYSYGYFHGQIDPYTHLYKWGDKSWHRNDSFINETGHATDLITNEAVNYIKAVRDKTKPFFLYVAYSVPHFPLDEEQKWLDLYPEIGNESRRLFAASMSHMDDGIGEIMSALQDENLEKETLVIFMSDNGGQQKWDSGPDYYENKFMPNDVLGDNSTLRGWKGDLYEGGIRVPAVLYWKGKVSPAKVTELTTVQDIYPTIASVIHAAVPQSADIEGIDIRRAIDGKTLPGRTVYWRTVNQFAIRKGNWKLIRTGDSPDSSVEELFNLSTDPFEEHNVLDRYIDIADELRKELRREVEKDGA